MLFRSYSVVVTDGRIAAVKPAGDAPPAGVAVIDATGKFLIPGLWDMHAHVPVPQITLPLFVAKDKKLFDKQGVDVELPYTRGVAIEALIDHAAREHSFDRIAIRRRNFIRPEAFPYRTANGTLYDHCNFERLLDRALKLADFEGFEARREAGRNVLECARLMGFETKNEKFHIVVSDTQAYKQFGNAVVVPVVDRDRLIEADVELAVEGRLRADHPLHRLLELQAIVGEVDEHARLGLAQDKVRRDRYAGCMSSASCASCSA